MMHASPKWGDAALHEALAAMQVELDVRFSEVMALNRLAHAGRGPSGKLLRPRLLLVTAVACAEGRLPRRATEISTVIELLHLATLHHDDVLDASPERRRNGAAHTRLGNKVSILLGDALMTSALDLLSGFATRRMLRAVSRAMSTTLRGEVEQHLRHRTLDVTPKDCVLAGKRKTGRLFALAAQLGAMLAGADREQCRHAARFGSRIGTAFQLIDDAADYVGTAESLGKSPGTDYREGIATLPLVYAWRRGSDDDRLVLAAGFGARGDGEEFAEAHAAVIRAGGIAYTLGAAERRLGAARASLQSFAPPEHRRFASDYVDDIACRIPNLPGEPRLTA